MSQLILIIDHYGFHLRRKVYAAWHPGGIVDYNTKDLTFSELVRLLVHR